MTLAKYFGRAATAASQVLQGFDTSDFEKLLEGLVIGIAFDNSACSNEGRASLDLLVRLLARLYPAICFIPRGVEASALSKELRSLARSINGHITIARASPARLTHCLIVGCEPAAVTCPTFYLGSEGWMAKFSTMQPMGSHDTQNPFGAGAAACIAASNLFRHVFSAQIPGTTLDSQISFSMFDYGSSTDANPALEKVVLEDVTLLGLGAIGNGALWALGRTPDLEGDLLVVDHEAVDEGNLQRYVLASEKDIDRDKVKLASRNLQAHVQLKVTSHHGRWQTLPQHAFKHLAVALDSAADRISVQGALPHWIINSWTQRGDLGVSHHGFNGEMACLACLYLPHGSVPDEDQIIAEALRMEDRKLDVIRPMLHGGGAVSLELMREIAARLTVPVDPLLGFVGQPLRSLYQGAICGGIVFELTKGAVPVRVEVPMAFQSAMAGVMLAAEIIKRASHGAPDWTTAKLNLLRKMPGDALVERRKKDRLGRCICQDEDYLAVYRSKYRS